MSTSKVIVASKNPVKIDATRDGFQQMFPSQEFSVTGIAVASGVGDQPMSDDETWAGTHGRIVNARAVEPDADFIVGIEGGIEITDDQMMAFAWIGIESGGRIGRSRSGTFLLPPKVQELVEQGIELGEANDQVFSQHNSKQQGGAIGLLSADVISRRQLYAHAVMLALVPFKATNLFVAHD